MAVEATTTRTSTGSDGVPRDERMQTLQVFVRFWSEKFRDPELLSPVDCRQSYKDYVPGYYAGLFGERSGTRARHLKWIRRLDGLLSMPRGAALVDVGGGYGVDSLLLAAFGYRVALLEITPHHTAICEHLRDVWVAEQGPLDLRTVLGRREGSLEERVAADVRALGPCDAMLANEVAHHIEPPDELFGLAEHALEPGGRLFLLEPNFWSPVTQAFFFRQRGLRVVEERVDEQTGETYAWGNEHIRPGATWTRIATRHGFELVNADHVFTHFLRNAASLEGRVRRLLERLPLVRSLSSTHIGFEFRRRGDLGPTS